jgi:hypothetical protein
LPTNIATLQSQAHCLINHVKQNKKKIIVNKIKQGFTVPNIIFKECLLVLRNIQDPHKKHLIEPLKDALRKMYKT